MPQQNFTNHTSESLWDWGEPLYGTVEQLTEAIGGAIAPIANHPIFKAVAKVPGLDWLLTGLGQVDTVQVEEEVAQLRHQYPSDDRTMMAQVVIHQAVRQAAQVGLLMNIIPPIALALFAVDLAAITKLQVEMTYRIAAAYGFDVNHPTRRGEAIALYALSLGTELPVKAGLSLLELIPGLGAVVGAASNAKLIYWMGTLAQQYYAIKWQKSEMLTP